MKTRVLIIAALAACLTTAQARIGESAAECEKRYGKPVVHSQAVSPPSVLCSYLTDKCRVTAWFMDGKAEQMMINILNRETSFTEDQIQVFLVANSGGSRWIEVDSHAGPDVRNFARFDGGATALLIKSDQILIETTAWKAAKIGMAQY